MNREEFTTYNPEELSAPERHHLLLSAVAPRPIAFASTVDHKGNVNLSPFSFFNVFSSSPAVMIFSPARSGRNNSLKHTHQNLLEVPEVVINVVNYAMVEQMSLASTAYDKGVNEFIKSGLTEQPSLLVKPPRVKESPVAFECLVQEIKELGQHGGAGNLVISEVKCMHVNNQYLDAQGRLDTTQLDLVGRMGGAWYCRASGPSLFTIAKPSAEHGIGVDALPEYIRNSRVLTGNQLGKLGGLPRFSSREEVEQSRAQTIEQQLADEEVQRLASTLIEQGKVQEAFSLLLTLQV